MYSERYEASPDPLMNWTQKGTFSFWYGLSSLRSSYSYEVSTSIHRLHLYDFQAAFYEITQGSLSCVLRVIREVHNRIENPPQQAILDKCWAGTLTFHGCERDWVDCGYPFVTDWVWYIWGSYVHSSNVDFCLFFYWARNILCAQSVHLKVLICGIYLLYDGSLVSSFRSINVYRSSATLKGLTASICCTGELPRYGHSRSWCDSKLRGISPAWSNQVRYYRLHLSR